jgi:hypothetical protein
METSTALTTAVLIHDLLNPETPKVRLISARPHIMCPCGACCLTPRSPPGRCIVSWCFLPHILCRTPRTAPRAGCGSASRWRPPRPCTAACGARRSPPPPAPSSWPSCGTASTRYIRHRAAILCSSAHYQRVVCGEALVSPLRRDSACALCRFHAGGRGVGHGWLHPWQFVLYRMVHQPEGEGVGRRT